MVLVPPRRATLTTELANAPPLPVEMFFAVTFNESAMSPWTFPLTEKMFTSTTTFAIC